MMNTTTTTGLEQWAERWAHVQSLKAEAQAADAESLVAGAGVDTAAQSALNAAQAVRSADAACAQVRGALAEVRGRLERVQARAAEVRDAAEAHADAFHAHGHYAGARFANYEAPTPQHEAALRVMQAFPCTDAAAPTQTALLLGPTGVGKTHLAAAWVTKFDPADGNAEFAQWRDVARSFEGLGKVAREKQLQRWDGTQAGDGAPANGCQHLALDDVGDGMDERDVALIGELIDRRANAGRVTLLTSNLRRSRLEALVGERIYSRLSWGGVRATFSADCEDFRTSRPLQRLPVPDLESAQVRALEAHAAELAEQVATLESEAQAAAVVLAQARAVANDAQAQHREALARLDDAERAPARLEAQRVYRNALDSLRADAAWVSTRRDGLSLDALQARAQVVRRHWALHVARALDGYQAHRVHDLSPYCWAPFADDLDELEPPRLGDVPPDALVLLAPEPEPIARKRLLSLEDVGARVDALAKTHRGAIVEALKGYGAKRTPDLKPEQYAPFMADLDAIENPDESAAPQTA